ncbi:hypothetical protein E1A91_A07G148900v1 [Gossypium mustelinum]|uniref:Uncharacterized protein n=1 Tax=Gossypium mustelinum TaxID=34275 RepID=A0A5D2YP24_GOSMU|nr:hypothetical protein E1A91_A07G148900v1 [Gossypium mustelinum]
MMKSFDQFLFIICADLSHDGFLFSDLSVSAAFRSGFELLVNILSSFTISLGFQDLGSSLKINPFFKRSLTFVRNQR